MLAGCAAEPIHIPGAIQPQGALMVLSPEDGRLRHASRNLREVTGLSVGLGERLNDEAPDLLRRIEDWLAGGEPATVHVVDITGRPFTMSGHVTAQGAVVELEPVASSNTAVPHGLYGHVRAFLDRLSHAASLDAMAEAAVDHVRALTGFNRTLLYRFDEKGDGTVLAESSDGVLPTLLRQRFPASDIPAQARALYVLNRLRLIVDAGYTPCPVEPALSPVDGRRLDLSLAALRSVSPVHLEYMRNMGTQASMSISIVVNGGLWGLISGHSSGPHGVDAQVRGACDMIGQVLSLNIEARQQAEHAANRLRLGRRESDLLAALSGTEALDAGLAANSELWLGITEADGAAALVEGRLTTTGRVPPENVLRDLAARIHETGEQVFSTPSLAALWPAFAAEAGIVSGVLAISVSQIRPDLLIWLRPEIVQEVEWAGNPHKAVEEGARRLHPRRSFETWREQVRLQARPWSAAQIESAASFRAAVQNFLLHHAEERAELSDKLERTNQELEAFSYSVSHDLRAPFRHIAGYAELLSEREAGLEPTSRHYLTSIKEAAAAAGRLVDDLLSFSQLGRHRLASSSLDMNKLAAEVKRSLATDIGARVVEWEIGDLPPAWGDGSMIRQALLNLMQNAVKYTAPREVARIRVTGADLGEATAYTVSDNGVGFEMAYARKLFGVFQRLHLAEEFEGTGIGLALVKRIVDRHGGTVSAQGTPGKGAEFSFTLPKRQTPTGDTPGG
nr:ATP-binding protein [Ancylobacter lacus]